jgi:methyl-accepting chemotaxis protein
MTIKQSLIGVCVLFGLVPSVTVGVIAYRAANGVGTQVARSFETLARQIVDKIDRNLFERYGDVQAFGINRVAHDTSQWGKGESTPLVQTMNAYVDTYDIYALTMLVDLSGKLAAVNTKDKDGKPIETSGLYSKNYADEKWFQDAKAGRFTENNEKTVTGTVVGDFHVNELAKSVYKDEGLALTFTAPVKDDSGKVIGYWHNVAKFALVEEIVRETYQDLAKNGLKTAEITLMHKDGRVFVDYDPMKYGKDEVVRDMELIGKLNLVSLGLPAATAIQSGEAGSATAMTHKRKGYDQVAGFTPNMGSMGFPRMPWGVIIRAERSEALAGVMATHRAVLASLAISAVAVALGAYFFASRLVAPIAGFVRRLRDIAEGEGDLTQRVDDSRGDELGELGKWFNRFIENVQKIVCDVARSSSQVSAAATEIAASSEEMAAGLNNQETQVGEMSGHIEQLAASVSQVASRCDEAAAAADASGRDAGTGGTVVTSTIEEMKGISTDVAGAAKGVEHLGQKSEQIGEIIKVINDIADQTNLLALNAAIEAARAGEHGRGFAVVADEVRKLAERTTKATEEVARSIREIQDETKSAVTQIKAGATRVTRGVDLANKAGEALARIVSGADGLRGMLKDIAASTQEQSAASSSISESVKRVRSVASESNQGATQAAQAAMFLSKEAENLQAIVKRFRTA